MPEAVFSRVHDKIRLAAEGSVTAGELRQVAGGLAGFFDSQAAASAAEQIEFSTSGQVIIPKTTGVVFLDGGRVYWDHSANQATYKAVNDRDFYAGTAVGDWASGDTFCIVNLNKPQGILVDLALDAFISALVGTVAVAGCNIFRRGGAHNFILAATSEAEKLDALSVNGFSPGSNWIIEGAFRIPSDGAGTVVDVNMGIASATHATDADSIAEHLFLHLDANNVNINLQSKDGATTVAATDTTIDYTEGTALSTRVEFWFDGRNPADIQCYINAALVLGSTVFRLDNAVGPLFLLKHMEKTSSTDTYESALDWLRVRLAEQ